MARRRVGYVALSAGLVLLVVGVFVTLITDDSPFGVPVIAVGTGLLLVAASILEPADILSPFATHGHDRGNER